MCDSLREKPNRIAEFSADYYDLAERIVFKHGGILDKFVGDGIMALFGFEKNDDEAAIAAVSAAEELKEEFASLKKRHQPNWEKDAEKDFEIGLGCGIHTGDVAVGLVGTGFRRQFTALGAHVNLAARICGRAASGETLISIRTKARIGQRFQLTEREQIDDFKNLIGTFKLFRAG
jgi:adenylate cyclase